MAGLKSVPGLVQGAGNDESIQKYRRMNERAMAASVELAKPTHHS